MQKVGVVMLGETSFCPFARNTFSQQGKQFTTITPIHYVNPHTVRSYRRKDGTFVAGYWRDGDGNTSINRATGYYARNPNAIAKILQGRWNR